MIVVILALLYVFEGAFLYEALAANNFTRSLRTITAVLWPILAIAVIIGDCAYRLSLYLASNCRTFPPE
jgi:hypothetical protein